MKPDKSWTNVGFIFPPDLGVIKVIPHYERDRATVTFELNGEIQEQEFDFDYQKNKDFEKAVEKAIRKLKE